MNTFEDESSQFTEKTGYVLDPEIQNVLITLYVGGRGFAGWIFTLEQIYQILNNSLSPQKGKQYQEYLQYLLENGQGDEEESLGQRRQQAIKDKLRAFGMSIRAVETKNGETDIDVLNILFEKNLISMADVEEYLLQAMQLITMFALRIPLSIEDEKEEEKQPTVRVFHSTQKDEHPEEPSALEMVG